LPYQAALVKKEHMGYLSTEIERLWQRREQKSLVRKQHSCGIFQEYDANYIKEDFQQKS